MGEELLINDTVLVYLAGAQVRPDLYLRKLGARFEDRLQAGSMHPATQRQTINTAYAYALGLLHASRADGTDVPMRETNYLESKN